MSKPKTRKLHSCIQVAFARVRLNGGVLCRQSSATEEAIQKGGGYIYFTNMHTPISPVAGRFLIEEALVKPLADGLFAGQSQSFEAVSAAEFNDFKTRYEALPVRVGEVGNLRDQREPA